MKSRVIIALSAFLLISSFSFAQKGPFLQLGVKVGANLNKIEGQSFKDEFNYGYNAGAFAMLRVGNKWHIQPELLWNQYSTKTASNFSDIYSGGNNLSDIKLNYL